MSRLQPIDPTSATGKVKEQLAAVQAKLSFAPNMFRVMANSPAVLDAYLHFSGSLAAGHLDAKLREQIALVTAQQNRCDYCLSAHSAIGKLAGLNQDQILASREGKSADEKTVVALTFAARVLDSKGQVSESDLDAVRAAGFSDGDIAEIIAHVALNVFTNYFNIAAAVEVDFPRVSYTELA